MVSKKVMFFLDECNRSRGSRKGPGDPIIIMKPVDYARILGSDLMPDTVMEHCTDVGQCGKIQGIPFYIHQGYTGPACIDDASKYIGILAVIKKYTGRHGGIL